MTETMDTVKGMCRETLEMAIAGLQRALRELDRDEATDEGCLLTDMNEQIETTEGMLQALRTFVESVEVGEPEAWAN